MSSTFLQDDLIGAALVLSVERGLGTSLTYYVETPTKKIEIPEVAIKDISEIPIEIVFPGTNYTLVKGYRNILFLEAKIAKKLFTAHEVGDVYLSEEGCMLVELPDHTALAYNLKIPFINSANGEVDITWSDGTSSQESYVNDRISGCGALCYYLAVVDEEELQPDTRLIPVGKTSTGETVYELKDSNDQLLEALYKDENTVAYYSEDWNHHGVSKYTYDEFIAYKPLLYWVDPLLRWVEFKNKRFISAAEMCKPVIYLYRRRDDQSSGESSTKWGIYLY